jgi:hypothetical protein
MTPRPTYIITLRADPDENGIAPARRLARLLKYAGRQLSLKCVHAMQAPPADAKPTDGEGGK